jgi:hypothetical protein
MNDTEAAAIEEGFKQIVIEAFRRYCDETEDNNTSKKWGDGAIIRFRDNLNRAREARVNALTVIEYSDEK